MTDETTPAAADTASTTVATPPATSPASETAAAITPPTKPAVAATPAATATTATATPPITPPITVPETVAPKPPVTPPVVPVVTPAPTPAATPAPAPKAAAPSPASLTQEQIKLNTQNIIVHTTQELLQVYVTNMDKPILNAVALANGAALLTRIIGRLLLNPFTAHLDVFYNFCVTEGVKGGLMEERNALRGIETIDKATRARIEIVYTLFMQAVAKNGRPINAATAVALTKCPDLVTYIQSKLA